MNRLTITVKHPGLDLDDILWRWFPRLVPSGQTNETVTYACRLSIAELPSVFTESLDGFVEEGTIESWQYVSNDCDEEEES